jgi:hypothetical protein
MLAFLNRKEGEGEEATYTALPLNELARVLSGE